MRRPGSGRDDVTVLEAIFYLVFSGAFSTGGAGASASASHSVAAAPAASVAAQASTRFENRLPLAGVAEKLAAAAPQWEALAEAPAPPVEKAPEKTK
ncbi:MAG: hypothetical protein ACHQ17_13825 [Polyangia bacterium]